MGSAAGAVREQRSVQAKVANADRAKGSGKGGEESGPKQTGAREYPVPPFPKQHQRKPGNESALKPAPMFEAPYYLGSRKLSDKVALITGGDSGIGRAVAVLFAREGATVAFTYLGEAESEDARKTREAIAAEGQECLAIAGDVRDAKFCAAAVAKTIEAFGRLNVLVNNAAFQVHTAEIEDLSEEHFDETLKTNLYGYFFMAKAAIPHMAAGDAIINTGSITGIMGSKHLLDYSMTKGGIHAFTRALAGSVVKRGIRVNAVAPGPVWTPLKPSDKQAGDVAKFGADTPMGRPAQPEEIAPAYVFLASPHCSSYITGEVLPIIGGYE